MQNKGVVGIHTDDMPNRKYREILLKNGLYTEEVTKGWYVATNPEERDGETTAWHSSYWDFIVAFLERKYGDNWCLSADQSLLLIRAINQFLSNYLFALHKAITTLRPFRISTSLFNMRSNLPMKNQLMVTKNGIRMYNLQAALIYSSVSIYTRNAIDARTTLSLIRDASELLPILLENGHTTLAGRLAGAFRNIQRDKIADQIVDTFKQADYDIREEDPFATKLEMKLPVRERSPYANRIRLMWLQMREVIIDTI